MDHYNKQISIYVYLAWERILEGVKGVETTEEERIIARQEIIRIKNQLNGTKDQLRTT